jgi:hypothetical protein
VKLIVSKSSIYLYPETPLENDILKDWADCAPVISSGSKHIDAPHMAWENNLRIGFAIKEDRKFE